MPSDLEMKRTLMQKKKYKTKKKKNTAQPGTKTWERELGEVGSGFSLDPMSKAVNSQKALQRLATTEGSLSLYSPKAGKHVTDPVKLAGIMVETASALRCRSILARGSSRTVRSVTLVRILGVYDFDMREWEETPPSVHLSLPLTVDVHPRNLDNVANLRKEKTGCWVIQEEEDLFSEQGES